MQRKTAGSPLEGVGFAAILGLTALIVIAETVGRGCDRAIGFAERSIAFAALLIMTFLAFNEYLARELRPTFGDLGGLWGLEGQMNMALLLMVVVGFVGGSLATQERKHIAVDAIERILSPTAARWVRRLTATIAAGLCLIFMQGSWRAVFAHSQDNFEGARVWGTPLAGAINALVRLMPGEKAGPASCAKEAAAGCPPVDFPSADAWIDAKYDAGLDPFDLYLFSYVDAGDRFPLWIPLLLLVFAFGVMALRFTGQALYPDRTRDGRVPGIPAASSTSWTPADTLRAAIFPGALLALGLGAWMGTGWLILIASIALVSLGSPLFVAIGVGTLACWVLIRDGTPETVVSDMFEATKKQELLSINRKSVVWERV